MALPLALYSTAQVRALDAHAIEGLGVQGYTLMKRAGEAAPALPADGAGRWRTGSSSSVAAVSNGGDGYVLARFAQAAGLTVTVLAAIPPEQLKGDARQAYEDCKASGGQIRPFTQELFGEGDVIVDALLGTGLRG